MTHMEILWLILGIGIGAGVVWLLSRSGERAHRADLARLEGACAVAEERARMADVVGARLGETIEAAASRAFKGRSEDLVTLADEKFKPFSARLESLDRELREVRTSQGSVSHHLESVARETANLTNALRKPNVRGRWGEVSLRNAVEAAGLTAHCDFTEQVTVESDDGRRRPDLVVNLPGGREVVVDAKVPLQAYLEAAAADDDDTRAVKLKEHAAQVRKQVQELAKKSYWEQFDRAPECVVMFLQLEPTLGAALEQDPSLFEDAARQRVILATPTTLLGILYAMAQVWRQEAVAENAERISELGRELYKRLITMGDRFSKLGRGIDGVVKSWNEAVGSLEGRVFVTARRFEDLGVAAGDVEVPKQVHTATRSITAPELADETDGRVVELPPGVAIDDDDYGTLGGRAVSEG